MRVFIGPVENRCMAPRGGVNRCYSQILMLFRFRLDTKVNSLNMQLGEFTYMTRETKQDTVQ